MTDISALEGYAGQLSEAAAQAKSASAKQALYVEGDAQQDVDTEGGLVPTLAKQARLADEKIDAALVDVAARMAGAMVFDTVAAGLAAVPANGFFSVPSALSTEYLILYKKVDGAAVEKSRYPSKAAVDKIQPEVMSAVGDEFYRTANHISGDSELILEGPMIMSLPRNRADASVQIVDDEEVSRIDTKRRRMILGLETHKAADVLLGSEGHSDGRGFPEFHTLATSTDALVFAAEDGSVALQVDTKNRRLITEFSLESSVEQRPPTVFVDVPPRIERNTSDPLYRLSGRVYQATATIARTGPGRYWAAWRADNTVAAEAPGNFSVLAYSDDGGEHVKEYGYLTYSPTHPENHIVDPMLWLDPEGNLWLFFGVLGNNKHFDGVQGSWAVICHNPNAETPVWGQPFRLSYFGDPRRPFKVNGQWYIVLDGWRFDAQYPPRYMEHVGPHVHKFDWRNQKLEHVSQLPPNNGTGYSGFFETEFVQRGDGSVLALLRWGASGQASQISYSISTDLMKTWTPWQDYTVAAPSSSSRMWLGRTPSGRLLLCWNNDQIRRTLTVGLSDDDGATYPYRVVLEPSSTGQVSYPIVDFGDNGDILVIYDNERTSGKRQIRIAKINEQQIVTQPSPPVQVFIVSDPANP